MTLVSKAKWLWRVLVAASRSYDAPNNQKLYYNLCQIVGSHRTVTKELKQKLFEEACEKVKLSPEQRQQLIADHKQGWHNRYNGHYLADARSRIDKIAFDLNMNGI